ncbi:DUF4199 family protein [Fulvivirgaceae bacterium PWU5]|uniref:DUF4199 family protein n=1 Tax=Dawidia cretensis TaxID=2782350 RepID=A0AAP2DYT4_9BACT|nr:DUF4199 domain-containing protein [Dawidia cretensis]MBT1709705.1 DUF4199 family protein [Dawidia cretensis]
MKKIVLINGVIAGAIAGGMLFISTPLVRDGMLSFDSGTLVGYTTMVVALSMVFFGIKSYRDQHLGGTITFGKALAVGALITVVASCVYALVWEVCYHTVASGFMDGMADYYLREKREEGATAAELEQYSREMNDMMVMYQNPFIRFGMTVMEILPVGVVLTLLSAVLLRKKAFLPATE